MCWEDGGARFLWAVLLMYICFVKGVPGLEGFSGGIVTYLLWGRGVGWGSLNAV